MYGLVLGALHLSISSYNLLFSTHSSLTLIMKRSQAHSLETVATVLPHTHQIKRAVLEPYEVLFIFLQRKAVNWWKISNILSVSHITIKKGMVSGFQVRLLLQVCCLTAIQNQTQTTPFLIQSFSPFPYTGTTNVSPAQDKVNTEILKHALCLWWLPSWKQTVIYCSSSDGFMIKAQIFFSLHLFLSLPTASWKTPGFSIFYFSNCILISEKPGKWDTPQYKQLIHYMIKNNFIVRECVRDFRNFKGLSLRMFFPATRYFELS